MNKDKKGISAMVANEFQLLSAQETIKALESDGKDGLSYREAERRYTRDGENAINAAKKNGVIRIFLSQFKDFLIVILLISAVVSFLISKMSGENSFTDAIIILAIVVLNAVIGTVQEFKAEKAIEALKKISSPTGTVIRGGKKLRIPSTDVVQGDIIILNAGDVCPADVRLIDSVELSAEESSLTGESVPSEKDEKYICAVNAAINEQKNMVFSGSGIATGHAVGIVTATGMSTQIGKIARMLENEESPETPLQKKLNHTGKLLGISVIVICIVIFLLGILKHCEPIETLMISISLAVAAIPEGLTAVVTIVLSLGVKRMAKKRAIVRKLPAVETLGSTCVICSDKTGTLTENKMTVAKTANYVDSLENNSEERKFILLLASLCNNAQTDEKGNISGAPTEAALMQAYAEEGRPVIDQFPRIGEIPFSSKRKMMTTVHRSGETYFSVSKGNPLVILERCTHVLVNGVPIPMTDFHKNKIRSLNKSMAETALRVLAVAKCERDSISISDDDLEKGLTFCGLIGLEDPPRKEVAYAVKTCKKAGIVPVMITGDQQLTAIEIAKRLGIWGNGYLSMTGRELSSVSVDALAANIEKYRVFASVSPEDKVKIVRAFQKNNKIVAMTGDGINDAPALKAADIGCAMGKNGTEVAQNASDMVLTDDNFATIVSAVHEGRNIFVNIRKTIHFLLSCNMGEILVVFLAFLMGLPSPLLPTQLLWVNLVTDSFPALALGAGGGDDDLMNDTFLEENKDVFSPKMWTSIVIEGAFIGALALLAFTIGRVYYDKSAASPDIGRTMGFSVLCFSQIVHAFNVSSSHSVFSSKRVKNKWLKASAVLCTALMLAVVVIPEFATAFHTTALNFTQWIIVAVLSLFPLVVSEIEKLTNYCFSKRHK